VLRGVTQQKPFILQYKILHNSLVTVRTDKWCEHHDTICSTHTVFTCSVILTNNGNFSKQYLPAGLSVRHGLCSLRGTERFFFYVKERVSSKC